MESKTKDRELLEKKYTMQQQQITKMEDYIQRNIAMATSSKKCQEQKETA
ncbi:hypothetical protein OL548_15810 [Lysinibacillus sp. MHQ-1]|nr:hypothetical protein OL548_15810 [Lysinibacillus sp. MHQ-1]